MMLSRRLARYSGGAPSVLPVPVLQGAVQVPDTLRLALILRMARRTLARSKSSSFNSQCPSRCSRQVAAI
jgi:hypothetical protein